MVNINFDGIKIVSFDIFDTLILRMVEKPVDIFELVQREYEKIKGKMNIDYKKIRIESEKEARQIANEIYGREEINHDDIFNVLNKKFDNIDIKILKQLEIEKEKEFCIANDYMKKIYDQVKLKNIKIIITSDMYLDKEVIINILKKNGYDSFERIFLSSEIMLTKWKGSMYSYILKETNCKPEEILHIGDNIYSDIKMAEMKGIQTHYYENVYNRAKKQLVRDLEYIDKNYDCIELSITRALINNELFNDDNKINDFWYAFGFKYVGILYYSLVTWIHNNAKNDGIEKLLFLSRDGYILKKAYETIYHEDKIDNEYVYASRRAFVFPTTINNFEDTLDFLTGVLDEIKVKDYIKRIGLDINDYVDEIKKAGFISIDEMVSNTDIRIRNFFSMISQNIKEKLNKEYKLLVEYINQIGIDKYKKIGIVDIGYNGNMQNSIRKLLNNEKFNVDLIGYYFATYKGIVKYTEKNNIFKGYFLQKEEPEYLKQLFFKGVEVIEYIFTAPHPSVERFYKENNIIKPVFENDVNGQKYVDNLIKLQDGALNFINMFKKYIDSSNPISPEIAFLQLGMVLSNPTIEEAEAFGDIAHTQGFGEIETVRYIAKPQNVNESIDEVDIYNQYKNSYWKNGFLKRLPENIFKKFFTDEYINLLNSNKSFSTMLKLAKESKGEDVESVVVYGAGEAGQTLIKALKLEKIKIKCIVDRNPDLWGNNIENILIESLDSVLGRGENIFAIGSIAYSQEIVNLLISQQDKFGIKVKTFVPEME